MAPLVVMKNVSAPMRIHWVGHPVGFEYVFIFKETIFFNIRVVVTIPATDTFSFFWRWEYAGRISLVPAIE